MVEFPWIYHGNILVINCPRISWNLDGPVERYAGLVYQQSQLNFAVTIFKRLEISNYLNVLRLSIKKWSEISKTIPDHLFSEIICSYHSWCKRSNTAEEKNGDNFINLKTYSYSTKCNVVF